MNCKTTILHSLLSLYLLAFVRRRHMMPSRAPLLHVLTLSSAVSAEGDFNVRHGVATAVYTHQRKSLSRRAPSTADIPVCHLPRGFCLPRPFTQRARSGVSDSHFKEIALLLATSHLASFAYFHSLPAESWIDSANSSRITASATTPALH